MMWWMRFKAVCKTDRSLCEKPPCLYVLHMSQKNALSQCQQHLLFECIIQIAPVTPVCQSPPQTGEEDGDVGVDSQVNKRCYGVLENI